MNSWFPAEALPQRLGQSPRRHLDSEVFRYGTMSDSFRAGHHFTVVAQLDLNDLDAIREEFFSPWRHSLRYASIVEQLSSIGSLQVKSEVANCDVAW